MKTQRQIDFEKFMEHQTLKAKIEHKMFMASMLKRMAIGIIMLSIFYMVLELWSAWMLLK